MDEQSVDLPRDRLAATMRLPRRVRHRDDDVSEEAPVLGFGREGEDVRRPVVPPVATVERTHARVAAEQHRDLPGGCPGHPRRPGEKGPDPGRPGRSRRAHLDLTLHRDSEARVPAGRCGPVSGAPIPVVRRVDRPG